MPAALTYPGVYVEEIPSGVRTITGVATSITAFIGRAVRGLVNEPTIINSYGEFERRFGGLGVNYPMSYAVRDFFANGGSQAAIVRLYNPPSDKDDGRSRLSLDGLDLVAASPGEWGKKLRVTIDVEVSDEVRGRLGLGKDDALFNLRVSDSNRGGASERFMNLTVVDSPRRLDKVLQAESNLIRWDGDWPDEANKLPKLAKTKATRQKLQDLLKEQKADKPDPNKIQMAREHYSDAQKDLEDDATTASKQLDAARKARPQVQADVLAAEQALEDAETKLKGDDGKGLDPNAYLGSEGDKTGLRALDKTDQFNLLCIPPDDRGEDVPVEVYQTAMEYCQHRRAVLIVDSPAIWGANKETAASTAKDGLSALGLAGEAARNAALYFPRVVQPDPYHEGRPDIFVPCGIVAGIMARTDVTRGVWKAPAGLDAAINGVLDLEVNLNDAESGMLNPLGINCLRSFPLAGRVIWGARTLRGADQLADEYKYVPVRRTALYIEESLYRGLKWVVFEPNDEPLWAQIRLNVGAFMHDLFRQHAFQGQTPRDAYFVKCDKETTTQNDIDHGIVNILVGFAPLKPAEFVVIKIQQMAGQIET